jgi:hypothetical protein
MAIVLTNAGEEWLVDKILEDVQTEPSYFGWGTGAGTAAKADTTLFTAATEARVNGSGTKTGSGSSAKARYVGQITADGTKSITNFGMFDAAGSGSPPSGGTLIVHADHTAVGLDAADSIEYTVDLDPA